MKSFFKILSFFFLPILAIQSCSGRYGDFQTAECGLQYMIVEQNEAGQKPKIGDVLELNYSYETENGKLLFNSRESGRKYMKTLEKPSHTGGSIEDGLAMMHEGDSAIFKISAENFLLFSEKYGHLPEGVNSLDPIIIKVRLVDIMDEKEMDTYMKLRYHKSEEQEAEILDKYLKNMGIETERPTSGFYFIEKKPGSGSQIKDGNIITVDYTLTLVDGSLVETTLGNTPLTDKVGEESYIVGWEEAIKMMRNGSAATVIIPSALGYGAEGTDNILPYSTLIFDIEILNVK